MGWNKLATTAYVDAQVDTADAVSELADVTITSSGANELLFTTGANTWVNYTLAEAGIQPLDAQLTTLAGFTAAQVTRGISDGNLLTANDAVADNDWLRIDGTEVEGRSDAEIKADLSLEIGTDVQAYNATLGHVAGGTYTGDDSITTLGTIGTGTWEGTTVAVDQGGTGVTTMTALKNALDDETWTFANAVTMSGNVEVAGNLDVKGTTTTIDSANLAVTDPHIMLNVLADQSDYTTGDSAIIFGHPTNASGGKIVNDAGTGFKFTKLHSNDDPASGTLVGEGSTTAGVYIDCYMAKVVLDEAGSTPVVVNGGIYFDGTDIFVGTD